MSGLSRLFWDLGMLKHYFFILMNGNCFFAWCLSDWESCRKNTIIFSHCPLTISCLPPYSQVPLVFFQCSTRFLLFCFVCPSFYFFLVMRHIGCVITPSRTIWGSRDQLLVNYMQDLSFPLLIFYMFIYIGWVYLTIVFLLIYFILHNFFERRYSLLDVARPVSEMDLRISNLRYHFLSNLLLGNSTYHVVHFWSIFAYWFLPRSSSFLFSLYVLIKVR